MTERERLIELIGDYTEDKSARDMHSAEFDEQFADYLLANGVIVPNNNLKLNRNRYIEMIDTYLEEPHSISHEWVELLKIMREIIEGAENDES